VSKEVEITEFVCAAEVSFGDEEFEANKVFLVRSERPTIERIVPKKRLIKMGDLVVMSSQYNKD